MSESTWVVRPSPRPTAALRLICVPHAGGSTATFAGWNESLDDVELALVQLPGRGTRLREPLCRSIDEAADRIVRALAPLDERPTVVFGHSMGALIAFEVARRLEAAGTPLVALAASARRAPSLPDRLPTIAHLPLDQFAFHINRRYEGVAPAVLADAELKALLLPILQADVAMVEAYHYRTGAPLRSPILVYGGERDTHVPRIDLDPWGRETTSGHSVRLLPGGHFFIQSHRDQLLATLRRDITVMPHAREVSC